jgi:hypothetical protein
MYSQTSGTGKANTQVWWKGIKANIQLEEVRQKMQQEAAQLRTSRKEQRRKARRTLIPQSPSIALAAAWITMEEDHNKEELPQLVAMDVSDDESISHSDDVDKLVDKLSEMHLCEHSMVWTFSGMHLCEHFMVWAFS